MNAKQFGIHVPFRCYRKKAQGLKRCIQFCQVASPPRPGCPSGRHEEEAMYLKLVIYRTVCFLGGPSARVDLSHWWETAKECFLTISPGWAVHSGDTGMCRQPIIGCTQLPVLPSISTYVVQWVHDNNVRNKKRKLLGSLYLVLFETGTCYIAQAGSKLMVTVSDTEDYKPATPSRAQEFNSRQSLRYLWHISLKTDCLTISRVTRVKIIKLTTEYNS